MKHLRLCFVGDSFVNGTGDPACLGWAGRLCVAAQQQGHEITYYNLGIRRQTSQDIADRWQEEVAARLPTECEGRIVFSFGVNDTTVEDGKERVTLAESLEHTRRILLAARQCFPTLMVGPPPSSKMSTTSVLRVSLSSSRWCVRRWKSPIWRCSPHYSKSARGKRKLLPMTALIRELLAMLR